ncbi:unnamed protein product [Linum trigynum]|uniref:Uncharacterized protein n=1 Tax=Linum trigynum TaxID=586398 RepID=A0AAV2GT93_9ROSI
MSSVASGSRRHRLANCPTSEKKRDRWRDRRRDLAAFDWKPEKELLIGIDRRGREEAMYHRSWSLTPSIEQVAWRSATGPRVVTTNSS